MLVVTSKTGAVIRDIVTTVRRKNPVIDIVVKDVRVQGEGAGKEIAKVLERVDNLGYDVIVIARGGGSLEDLAPFYDETLVRAVYKMKTPVVSAVGHETDFRFAISSRTRERRRRPLRASLWLTIIMRLRTNSDKICADSPSMRQGRMRKRVPQRKFVATNFADWHPNLFAKRAQNRSAYAKGKVANGKKDGDCGSKSGQSHGIA